MQIDAVNIDVGMPEALLDVRAGVDAHDFAPGYTHRTTPLPAENAPRA